jgi:hypothetical protein
MLSFLIAGLALLVALLAGAVIQRPSIDASRNRIGMDRDQTFDRSS